MKITVGYISVLNVYVEQNSYDDYPLIYAEDPANEINGFERPYKGTFAGAWRKAMQLCKAKGGTVTNPAPTAPRRPPRPSYQNHLHGTRVHTAPWSDPIEFSSRKAARKYARKHAQQIADNWDF